MRPYLSWIEGLTTNQYVEGSNPPGRTILKCLTRFGGFFFFLAGFFIGILAAGFSAGFLPMDFQLALRLLFCKLLFASAFSYEIAGITLL